MLDVHPPHEPILGWKEFLVHLGTITIGLLIALSLEGWVEWMHHRHLVHEAEASLHGEIERNSQSLRGTVEELHKNQAALKHDVTVLDQVVDTGKMPEHDHMEIYFHIHGFENLGWKTAQATGAVAYMSYEQAQQFADIYTNQDELADAEKQAARDAILSLAPFMDSEQHRPDPTKEEARAIREKVEILEGQLLLVDSLMTSLDTAYGKYLKGKD